MEAFNNRWNIKETSNPAEEFRKFQTRIFNEFDRIDAFFSKSEIRSLCQVLGLTEVWETEYHPIESKKFSRNIISALKNTANEKRFYFILETIFFFLSDDRFKNSFFEKLKFAVELSKINLSVLNNSGDIILYPRGEKYLDIKLVEEVLTFLNPESQKHFIEALVFYEKRTGLDAIKSAESIRRSVEEFLRFKLNNQKGLDSNKGELLIRLKQDGRDSFIRNIISQTLSNLDQYFNENSKHNDGDIDENENEYLIYQAGVLMRYINKSTQ